jgi:hypothetical protein
MNNSSRLSALRHVFAGLMLVGVLSSPAHAGPPLICHPYEIGDAPSLPGGDWRGADRDYDRTHLVRDTLALLTPETPVIVRMETLRRAAIYATGNLRKWQDGTYTADDRALAGGLIKKLRERTQQTADHDRALALFDLGFFAETLRQTELDPALDGYALLQKAAALRGSDSEIQFALALASVRPQRPEHATHLAQARATAQSGTLLAANLRTHFGR